MKNTTQIIPLGDEALLVRFAFELDDSANQKVIEFANFLKTQDLPYVKEIAASLVSVLVRYDNKKINFFNLSGLLRLALSKPIKTLKEKSQTHILEVNFDGEDLPQVAQLVGLSISEFIKQHNSKPLRVLTTGFAPGFVYCGMHKKGLFVDRREQVRKSVAAGTVIFAAGQSAITATSIPTGWHVIGRTDFINLDISKNPPTKIKAGDYISFVSEKS